MKKFMMILIILLLPFNVFAYSNKLIIPGEPVGIEVYSDGIYVVDFYKVNGELIGKNQGIKIGDIIYEVNGKKVKRISDLNKIINKTGSYKLGIKRDNKDLVIDYSVSQNNNTISTGLYVKDKITGIGTLSYIDPESKIFASLGHEIYESTTMSKFELSDGNIYEVNINSINKSNDNDIGELHASITNKELGVINKNEINGIYGKYTGNIDNNNLIEITNYNNIKKDIAYIRLALDNKVDDYEINIISLDNTDSVKNIYFEISDKRLLEKTGGVVQGMSGSPIIQDGKVIGVVNYVVVDDVKKGYGIFIEKMLEEGDKLLLS